jgi:hypothetical protein
MSAAFAGEYGAVRRRDDAGEAAQGLILSLIEPALATCRVDGDKPAACDANQQSAVGMHGKPAGIVVEVRKDRSLDITISGQPQNLRADRDVERTVTSLYDIIGIEQRITDRQTGI